MNIKLNAKTRKTIYGCVAAIMVALFAFRAISPDQVNSISDAAVKITASLTAFLAFVNTDPSSEPTEIAEDSDERGAEPDSGSDE